jgi:uncharacterized protein (DUF362 family)
MMLSRRDVLRAAGLLASSVLIPGLIPDREALARWSEARPQVALAQADSYDRELIRAQVRGQIEALGGLADVVHPGDKVAIKINLTGGTWWESQIGVPAVESMVTHPEVVRALVEVVLEADPAEVSIVEAVWDDWSFDQWGYTALADDLGVKLVDLNTPDKGTDFVSRPVGKGSLIYKEFKLHPVLDETDVFMSVAKMKCHASAGVTHSMKNLIGITPLALFMQPGDSNRTALHGSGNSYQTRLPSVIVDLNRARPIHFSLIDGVLTSEGGEGPWLDGWSPVAPGLLVAGKNPVATDAVATAAMGFEPDTKGFTAAPFLFCLNHLQLANALGLGPHRLDEIEIVGAALDDVRFPFRPYGATDEEKQTRRLTHPMPYGRV